MRHWAALGCRFLAVIGLAAVGGRAACQEIRAFWADAFSPAIKSRQEVDDLLRRLRLANCNAVFVQVRKGGDAYYVSRYEPWAADNPERFDGLQYLIQQAHAGQPRIAVHAWINTCAVGRSHGNPHHVAIAHPDWLSLSDAGADYDGEATKIDPGHPAAADHTFRIYLDVARRYDVDGIHFDFVRYGGAQWGYSPLSVARFNARHGRSGIPRADDPLWMQWRRDQGTQLVRKVYAMAVSVKPKIVVSAATITWGQGPSTMQEWNTKSAAMTRVFQDWRSWMEEGILDLNCLMSYYREARHAEWFRLWIDWAKDHQYGRWAVPSSGIWLNPIKDSLTQIEAIRAPSKKGSTARGVLLYCYGSTNVGSDGTEQRYNEEFYRALSQQSPYGRPPFATPASEPEMPWKTHPKTGHIKGFVLDVNSLEPVDGAVVLLRRPVRRRIETDGTGFYAFVDLPPGRAELTVSAKGYAPVAARAEVRAGVVQTTTLMVGQSPTPFVPSLAAAIAERDGAPVRLRRVIVVGGTDHFVGRLFVAEPGLSHAVQVIPADEVRPPLQAGDVVALTGVMATDEGERLIRDARLRLIDMQMPSPETGTGVWELPNRDGALGVAVAPGMMRIAGLVSSVSSDEVSLRAAAPVEVRLSERKGCGVEDEEAPLPPPPLAAKVEVTGVVTMAARDGQTTLRLWPRTPDDLSVVEGPGALIARIASAIVAPPAVMYGAYILWRFRNERVVRR